MTQDEILWLALGIRRRDWTKPVGSQK
jgi:hypothetical protein